MATLHLICGLPCAGKTTLAKRLEQEYAALRLTPDEWHIRLFGQDIGEAEHDARHTLIEASQTSLTRPGFYGAEHDVRHTLIEALLWDVAARVLTLGVNVILDFGFWGQSEREDYRSWATQLGANTKIHFLNVPEDVLLARLAARNAQLPPNTFAIAEAQLKEWLLLFQPPMPDELDG